MLALPADRVVPVSATGEGTLSRVTNSRAARELADVAESAAVGGIRGEVLARAGVEAVSRDTAGRLAHTSGAGVPVGARQGADIAAGTAGRQETISRRKL